MNLPPHAGTLAAELMGVLLAYPDDYFSPGELASTLGHCPAWGNYLAEYAPGRGHSAAIGRYLNECGLAKAGHHRTRGSLYARDTVLACIQQMVEAARQQASADPGSALATVAHPPADAVARSSAPARIGFVAGISPEINLTGSFSPLPVTPVASAITPPLVGDRSGAPSEAAAPTLAPPLAGSPEAALPLAQPVAPGASPGPPPERRRNPEGAARMEAPAASAVMDEQPRRRRDDPPPGMGRSTDGGGNSFAEPRPAPVIGWRRRSTDLARSPRPQHAAAAAAAAAAPPMAMPYPIPAYNAYPGGGAPPVWVGGGSAFGPPGQAPGGVMPYTLPAEIAAPSEGVEEGLPLGLYWNQIRRHAWKIALASIATTALVTFYTLRIPKLYESVATLRMDFNIPSIAAEAANNPSFDPTTLIQTAITDLGQRSVILDAVRNSHLDRDPALQKELGVRPGTGAVPTVLNPDALDNALVGLIAGHLTAISPTNTQNIDIHYRSLNPATSAEVANAMANALIRHDFDTRQQEENDTLRFMNKQIAEIQARLETEQQQLTDYQHQHNMLNPDAQGSLENSALSTVQTNYLNAQQAVTNLQAEMSVLQTGHPTDALLASSDGAALRPAYDALQTAQGKFDLIKTTRGPRNPEYQAAAAALAQAQQQFNTATTSVRGQISVQYEQARRQLVLIAAQLAKVRQSAQQFTDISIDYDNIKREFDNDQKLHDTLEAQIKHQQLLSSVSSSALRVTNQATPNGAPVYPDPKKNATLAFLFSLFAGCALAVLVGYLDQSFKTPDEVERFLRIPLLGALPAFPRQSSPIELAEAPTGSGKGQQRSAFAESILMLRTAVLYAAPHGFRTLCITSAQPQEGKSVILANLAISLALHGSKVLLVDGDIRRPTQHRIFEAPNQLGLSNVLRQSAPMEECFRATTVERLYLMPAGPAVPNPSELVATMLAQVLTPLMAEFDYVLVDSPPVLGFADAVSISTVVEGTLIVARAGKTQRELVRAALQPLRRVRARILGLVLNQVSSSLSPYYSYYQDHYARYYQGRDESEEQEVTK